MLENVLANKPSDGKLLDLGDRLKDIVKNDQDSTVRYSLINKDLRGLHFAFKANTQAPDQSKPDFSNCKLENFNFDNAKLNCSFKGSTIKNCSFENVTFTAPIDFSGITIDSDSLRSLGKAIKKYNEKNPNNQMAIANIKIEDPPSTLYKQQP